MKRRFSVHQSRMTNVMLTSGKSGVIPVPAVRMNVRYKPDEGEEEQITPLTVTLWKPSSEELSELVAGDSYIVLSVIGDTIPPVCLGVCKDDPAQLVELITGTPGS